MATVGLLKPLYGGALSMTHFSRPSNTVYDIFLEILVVFNEWNVMGRR